MSIKILVIINPSSGKGKMEEKIDEIKKNLEEQNMEVEIVLTQKTKNAKKIIDEHNEEKDLILVCGGDGTLNEAVSAMIENDLKDVTLSFVPLGTTNDLARTLNIPIKDISVTKKLLQTTAKRIDIGRWNKDKYFCYVAACGEITYV